MPIVFVSEQFTGNLPAVFTGVVDNQNPTTYAGNKLCCELGPASNAYDSIHTNPLAIPGDPLPISRRHFFFEFTFPTLPLPAGDLTIDLSLVAEGNNQLFSPTYNFWHHYIKFEFTGNNISDFNAAAFDSDTSNPNAHSPISPNRIFPLLIFDTFDDVLELSQFPDATSLSGLTFSFNFMWISGGLHFWIQEVGGAGRFLVLPRRQPLMNNSIKANIDAPSCNINCHMISKLTPTVASPSNPGYIDNIIVQQQDALGLLDIPVVASTQHIAPVGANDINAILMLHCETYNDSSLAAQTIINVGSPPIVPGGGPFPAFIDSILFPIPLGPQQLLEAVHNPNQWIGIQHPSSSSEFAMTDFCIDFWLKPANISLQAFQLNKMLVTAGAPNDYWSLEMGNTNGKIVGTQPSGNATINITNFPFPTPMTPGTWHHIVVERFAGVDYWYIDGFLQTKILAVRALSQMIDPIRIGEKPHAFFPTDSNGEIDELRISNVSRFRGEFTPPVAPYALLLPPPNVASVFPGSGLEAGGTPITVSGTFFQSGATVDIDGNPCTSVVFVNPNTITCVTPLGTAGAKDVKVTNPDVQNHTLLGGFTYIGPVPDTIFIVQPFNQGGGPGIIAPVD